MDDWKLLGAWQAGDNDAGEALVARYMGLLTRFFHNKLRNSDDAAELISETLLACTKGSVNVHDPRAFRSFLFGVAMNQLRNYYRKQAKRKRELADFEDVCVGDSERLQTPTSAISQREEIQLLVRSLRRLPLDQQIVLELSYFESLDVAEIAELLGSPAATVYTRLRRGRERLKVVMTEISEDPALQRSTMVGLETWAVMVREQLGR